MRDLPMFNEAIDSKPGGCDIVALKVEDVTPNVFSGSSDRSSRESRAAGQVRVGRTCPTSRRWRPCRHTRDAAKRVCETVRLADKWIERLGG
jgi:hypothetical protein